MFSPRRNTVRTPVRMALLVAIPGSHWKSQQKRSPGRRHTRHPWGTGSAAPAATLVTSDFWAKGAEGSLGPSCSPQLHNKLTTFQHTRPLRRGTPRVRTPADAAVATASAVQGHSNGSVEIQRGVFWLISRKARRSLERTRVHNASPGLRALGGRGRMSTPDPHRAMRKAVCYLLPMARKRYISRGSWVRKLCDSPSPWTKNLVSALPRKPALWQDKGGGRYKGGGVGTRGEG